MIYNTAPKGKIQFKTQKAAETHLFLHTRKHNLRCLAPHIIQEAQESILGVSAHKDMHPGYPLLCEWRFKHSSCSAALNEGRIDGQGTELPRVRQQH